MDFAERLKIARGKRSQKQFAEMVGVHTSTFSRWERGDQVPNQTDLCNILKHCQGVNPTWLITGEGPREKESSALVEQFNEKSPRNESIPENAAFDSLGMVEGMGLLTKIYTSGDNTYIRAINANLMAFSDAVENKAKAVGMENRMKEMEADLAEMKRFVQEMKKQEADRERLSKEEPLPDAKAA